MQEQEQLDISPLQEFPPSPTVTDVPLFPNSTTMADNSGSEISFSDQEDMAVEDIQPNDALVNTPIEPMEIVNDPFEPSLNNSNDANTLIPEGSINQPAMDINHPQEDNSALYSYKPSDAFKPSFNNSSDAINQPPEDRTNQSSLSLPLEISGMDINTTQEADMSLQLEDSFTFKPSFSNSDCSPQPLSELSSPLNFQGFSSVPLCILGK